MEVFGKSLVAEPTNVIYLSSILNQDGSIPSHKCDRRCRIEHLFGNMYHCKLTGVTHICDKNCNQRILYDNRSSLCRVSGLVFPLSPVEKQAVRGLRRKLDGESPEGCAFKRRRDAQLHPSPFERSFQAVAPICSQIGDSMDMRLELFLLPSKVPIKSPRAARNGLFRAEAPPQPPYGYINHVAGVANWMRGCTYRG